MGRATNHMIAEALLAGYRGRPRRPDDVTGEDLNEAYAIAREASGNPLPLAGTRVRGIGPKTTRLSEDRYDAVLDLYRKLLKHSR